MALIHCPECGKEISDLAKQCLHCGYPLPRRPKNHLKKPTTHLKIDKKEVLLLCTIGILVITFISALVPAVITRTSLRTIYFDHPYFTEAEQQLGGTNRFDDEFTMDLTTVKFTKLTMYDDSFHAWVNFKTMQNIEQEVNYYMAHGELEIKLSSTVDTYIRTCKFEVKNGSFVVIGDDLSDTDAELSLATLKLSNIVVDKYLKKSGLMENVIFEYDRYVRHLNTIHLTGTILSAVSLSGAVVLLIVLIRHRKKRVS